MTDLQATISAIRKLTKELNNRKNTLTEKRASRLNSLRDHANTMPYYKSLEKALNGLDKAEIFNNSVNVAKARFAGTLGTIAKNSDFYKAAGSNANVHLVNGKPVSFTRFENIPLKTGELTRYMDEYNENVEFAKNGFIKITDKLVKVAREKDRYRTFAVLSYDDYYNDEAKRVSTTKMDYDAYMRFGFESMVQYISKTGTLTNIKVQLKGFF